MFGLQSLPREIFSQLAKTLPATNSTGPESQGNYTAALDPNRLAARLVPRLPQIAQWGSLQPLSATSEPMPPSTFAAERAPEESKIEVQETSQVILALQPLWASHGAQLAEPPIAQAETSASWTPIYQTTTSFERETVDKVKTAASVDETKTSDEQWEADWELEEEELIDLFPRRESRPYGAMKDHKNLRGEVEEGPGDIFPRRGPRPY